MSKSIYGVVKSEPLIVADYSIYEVENKENKYVVISKDVQSAKDAIFIHTNQQIYVKGEILKEDIYNNIIVTEKSIIQFNNTFKKYSDKE